MSRYFAPSAPWSAGATPVLVSHVPVRPRSDPSRVLFGSYRIAPDSTRANWGKSHIGHPVDVARYAPNGYGLYDMAGNVWEYTADPWPGSAGRYVIRGGSYGASAINLRVGYRDSHPRGGAAAHVGFRCAR